MAVSVFFFSQSRVAEWQPAVDIYRTTWGWIVKLDLAGVRMEDVHVQVSKQAVTVAGVRRDFLQEDGCSQYLMEITYSRFERKIELPEDLSKAQIRMDYRDGILYVRIRIGDSNEDQK